MQKCLATHTWLGAYQKLQREFTQSITILDFGLFLENCRENPEDNYGGTDWPDLNWKTFKESRRLVLEDLESKCFDS